LFFRRKNATVLSRSRGFYLLVFIIMSICFVQKQIAFRKRTIFYKDVAFFYTLNKETIIR